MTANEKELLRAMIDSEFQSSDDPTECAVWIDCLDTTIRPRSIPGVMSSLVKKGYANTDGVCVNITKLGWEIYQKEKSNERPTNITTV